MVSLRRGGHSLPEIMRATQRGSSTVFAHVKNVQVLQANIQSLKLKQGGSRERSQKAWAEASTRAKEILGTSLSEDQRLFLLLGIYWGEGNKKELNLINSDPGLIKTFISCLKDIGVENDELKISLRIYEDIDRRKSIRFWSDFLSIDQGRITSVEVLRGRKSGKLEHGMCRVRVAKSATYFKLLTSLIREVKKHFDALVVQRIE